MNCGGCISHHHGVGKIRKVFIDRTLPRMALDWQKKIKEAIDPNNVFAINNTIPRSDGERDMLAAVPMTVPKGYDPGRLDNK